MPASPQLEGGSLSLWFLVLLCLALLLREHRRDARVLALAALLPASLALLAAVVASTA
ncbi:GlyGly-CTERM sorting domain-containing protein [Gallaecimonas kandeliae]|uniref:GlyGly-CTERM sorting domain-containing protein n=1 Tax=Gallaecimonas kandeliae TaxID=3029055 RepID=UPI0026472D52|nr:GlyGly-CTERM sorting domain-containing protein [Gallaecimonas kandeliae]WKE64561.1 GlyGly-CTERM sorting domain-containing protein [Gallaecimonas kandeliae]